MENRIALLLNIFTHLPICPNPCKKILTITLSNNGFQNVLYPYVITVNAFSYTKIEIYLIIPSYYNLFNYPEAAVLLLFLLNIFN